VRKHRFKEHVCECGTVGHAVGPTHMIAMSISAGRLASL